MSERCPACRCFATRLSLLIDGRYQIYRCSACKTEFFRLNLHAPHLVERNVQSEYWEPHKFAFYSDPRVQEAFAKRYGEIVDTASQAVAPVQSVLDVGCGTGNFLTFAQHRGLDAVGVDVDPDAVETARRRGLNAFHMADLDSVAGSGQFDALSMWDVVEHLIDPFEVLATLLPRVRPGGVLMFETPDGGFPLRRAVLRLHAISGGRIDLTSPLYYWEHKIYFTTAGFARLMDRLSCDVVDVRRTTSVREKMSAVLGYEAASHGTWGRRALANSWPLLERASARARLGNKLLIIARKRETPAEVDRTRRGVAAFSSERSFGRSARPARSFGPAPLPSVGCATRCRAGHPLPPV
jgi:2-polyprenyl-3-methyl-5-hydroxy-6-metoxy-1,4-benzoquinol methylase